MADQGSSAAVHAVDPAGVQSKGLRSGTVGVFGATIMGLSSTAPVYSMAATIGFIAAAVGVKAPACLILGFIPMLFTAYAYREWNNVVPDCGTAFTWGTKAFGPWVGWFAGWCVAVTGIIFLASAAEVAGQYFLDLFGQQDLESNGVLVAITGTLFVLLMAYIAYRGLQIAAWMQTVLVILQYIALALISVAAFWAVFGGSAPEGSLTPEMSWFLPTGLSFSQLIQGVLLCTFLYWGWDAILSINEETKDPEKTPGRAALIATVILLVGYLVVTTATISYAGLGEEGIGLNNASIQDDILAPLADSLIGTPGMLFVVFVTLLSVMASAQTTILPTARGTLAMGVYKALPARFASVHPKFMTPGFSTFVTCAIGIAFYIVMSIISDNVLAATIESIALAISLYYAIVAFACTWYFRKELFLTFKDTLFKLIFPVLGGAMLMIAFFASAVNMASPDYDGTTLLGVGTTFVVGIGSILVGVVLMIIYSFIAPPFFRGEVLKADTPVLVPDE